MEDARTHEDPRHGSAHEAVGNHAKIIEKQHELSLYQIAGLRSHTTVQLSASPPDATREVAEGSSAVESGTQKLLFVMRYATTSFAAMWRC